MKDIYLANQAAKLIAGHIDRRGFIKSTLATGLALPGAFSLADRAMAAVPEKGGSFKLALGHGSPKDLLDPATYRNDFAIQVGYMFANNLTVVNARGELEPELAESYDSTDARVWAFKLKKDVTFHNGKTLTGEDVVASINHHRGEDSRSAARALVSQIEDVQADGDNVLFTLKDKNADFPYILSDYHLVILPSSNGRVNPRKGVGTGSYTLEKYEPGVRAIGKRNPNYFKTDAGHFDDVELLSIADGVQRQNLLITGEVDAIDQVNPKIIKLMERVPAIKILEKTGTLHYAFPMRVDAAPFDNTDLRMALKLAVKRQELLDKVLLGHGTLGNDVPVSSAMPFYAGDIPQHEFDAEKAAEYYKKSGHSGKIQLSVSDAAFVGAVKAAELIAASGKECGIDIEVVREADEDYWSKVWNEKPWCACYWSGRPTIDWAYASAYLADSKWNDTAWRTTPDAQRFNEIVLEARGEMDKAKRAALYKQSQMLLGNDGGALIPVFANYIMGVSKKIGYSDDVASNWAMDGYRATERWWRKS